MIPSPPDTRASLILRLPDAANVAAWDEFVAIYGPLVFRMARRQGLQSADADDLVQEVFASDGMDRIDGKTCFVAAVASGNAWSHRAL